MKKIVINSTNREKRVAVLEQGRLVELYIERPDEQRIVGNIYKGKVENILPGMQAAFIDIGTGKNAFLYVDDCRPPANEDSQGGKKQPSINEVLTKGQEVVVQITKEPIGTKGARATMQISLPGRYLVFMPHVRYIGVSRKIQQEKERERLKSLALDILEPEEGVIIRTLAERAGKEEFESDIRFLRARWQNAWGEGKEKKSPSLIYRELDLVSRVVRDMLSEEVEECIIDSRPHYTEVLSLLSHFRSGLKEKVSLYPGKEGIFSHYSIEADIERALKRKVWLKSGGYLVIDQTEAMTVFDVNTGKYTGSYDLEETVVKTNLEACREIARQLRLRDLGGIIIIDFIDMAKEEHRQSVRACMENELRKDRTKTHLLDFTQLGLLEMTRKKERQNLADVLMKPCPACDGRGRILSEESVLAAIERELYEYKRGGHAEAVLLEVHPHIEEWLREDKEARLRALVQEAELPVYIRANGGLNEQRYHIAFTGTEEEVRQRIQG
ncbi:Rne/Rng family ribonuclease [Aneurinibacillus tyrosinisolvens]|uniref:Rne/Rng family ribonuclease n=1 Tax=Aneurinibacillus tyrosinisolvens TaxID=1443435 RepID=UPI000699E984|nr:Rne/Rng family ribonuclease [Aneurinibacillus tyrosinisolvens]